MTSWYYVLGFSTNPGIKPGETPSLILRVGSSPEKGQEQGNYFLKFKKKKKAALKTRLDIYHVWYLLAAGLTKHGSSYIYILYIHSAS